MSGEKNKLTAQRWNNENQQAVKARSKYKKKGAI